MAKIGGLGLTSLQTTQNPVFSWVLATSATSVETPENRRKTGLAGVSDTSCSQFRKALEIAIAGHFLIGSERAEKPAHGFVRFGSTRRFYLARCRVSCPWERHHSGSPAP